MGPAIGLVICMVGFVLMCIPRSRGKDGLVWTGIGLWILGFVLSMVIPWE